MPLPIISLIAKFLLLKVFKGAVVGVIRYVMRIFKKPQTAEDGQVLTGVDHVEQVVNKEWKRKDNVIFLILMLSSALYGLQELLIWMWIKLAKWRYPVFFTFTPAALELPDEFIQRVHGKPWPTILREIFQWLMIASLFYWPKTKHELKLVPEEDVRWVTILRNRKSYLLRVDQANDFRYQDMRITINETSDVIIKTDSGLIERYPVPS